MEETMKWEYKTLDLGLYGYEDKLNNLGTEGWELVSVDNYVAYFKRPIRTKSEDEIMKHFEGRQSLV